MAKILIGVPCMDNIPARFAHSLVLLQKVGECAVMFEIGSLIYTSRNNIAKRALELEADYVFWLDSDMVFEPDTLARLYQTMQENEDIDMISGLYFRRVPPFTPVLFDRLDMDEQQRCYWSEFKKIPDKPFRVGGVGFGCVLMKTDRFFDIQARYNTMFAPIGNTGEDLAFCWRARECGYDIWCDPSVKLGHVGHTIITEEFYNNYQLQKSI